MTILIVDDNEANRYQLQVLLGGNGYQVVSATQGAEALALARQQPPHLVVTDILMPVMDGFALCREWQQDERLRSIPLIFYTATYTDERDREFALSLGAARFLVKPEEPEIFLRTILDVLYQVQHLAPPTGSTPLPEETGFLKQYNETLIRKLEQKMQRLEEANRALERDITERKRAEDQLRKLACAVEQSPVSIIITDRAGNIEFVNPKFTQVTGYGLAEVLGKNPRFLKSGETTSEEYRQLWETIHAGKEWHGEFHNRRKNGTLFWETASISPIRDAAGVITHFLAVKEDTSERKLLESKFLRAQRVEGVGSLASGIAHDLNNILTPILICAPMLRDDLSPCDHEAMTRTIEMSAQRAVDIVKQLLGFARGTEGLKAPLPLKHLLRDMSKMVTETFPRSIQFTEDCPPDLWPVVADATQIYQVLLNLCVNARDAMPHGGHLKLSASNVMLDESYVSMSPEASAGPHVLIEVADTGTGIPDAVRERMFDPFFTTKNADKGTGLGLTTVLGIVKDHHGFIILKTQVGEGTTFHVYLPAKPKEQAIADAAQNHAAIPDGTNQLVLVVDDESAIREVMERTLRRHGYQVLLAAEGIEALQRFTQAKGAVAAVVADLMMPLMDGLTLCRTLRRLSPTTPIILSSGASCGDRAEEITRAIAEQEIKYLLHKPYTNEDLLKMLHEVLHEKPPIKPAEPTK
jgi:PAS domain S-box-containing protein